MKIAIAGFQHETNTFAPSEATWDDFARGGSWPPLQQGEDLVSNLRDMNIAISGFIGEAQQLPWTLAPLAWAACSPSAHVTQDAYERMAELILDRLRQAMPVDAVYLCLHGAMVPEHLDDGEGELIRRIRAEVGSGVPIFVTLDLHANVTRLMMDQADLIQSCRTYPHIDMATTGAQVARLLHRRLSDRQLAIHGALRRLPFLIPIIWQCSELEPMRTLLARMAEIEQAEALSMSFNPGFPAADFAECGPTILSFATSQAAAERSAGRLAQEIEAMEGEFAGQVYGPAEAVDEAMRLASGAGTGPVVIADVQDNPGAGSDSDTTGMLRALVAAQVQEAALGLVWDREVARIAHQAGVGAEIRVKLGGKSGVPGDAPFEGAFQVMQLSDGRIDCHGPYYQGARMNLGPSAWLRIGGIDVGVASGKAQMADQALFRALGIEPRARRILVNKSAVHFRADFTPIARAILIAISPGPALMDLEALPWTRLPADLRRMPQTGAVRG